jgi:hypothetical protein
MSNELDLDAIRARAEAATVGPWEFFVDQHRDCGTVLRFGSQHIDICHFSPNMEDDAEFIAHARADVPALIAEVEGLRAEVTALQALKVTSILDQMTADAVAQGWYDEPGQRLPSPEQPESARGATPQPPSPAERRAILDEMTALAVEQGLYDATAYDPTQDGPVR